MDGKKWQENKKAPQNIRSKENTHENMFDEGKNARTMIIIRRFHIKMRYDRYYETF